jgi:hypothetical protein
MLNLKRALTVLAAGVAITSVAGLSAASVASASVTRSKPDATPACGILCSNIFSEQTGPGVIMSAFVPGSNGLATTAKAGDKIDLKLGSNTFSNQDFILTEDETTGQACSDGDLAANSYACLRFAHEVSFGDYTGSFPVIEAQWSPYGVQSGLDAGVAVAHVAGEAVTLQPDGVSANTQFVLDLNDAHKIGGIWYAPAVLGSDTNSSDPLVLQVNTGTKNPANALSVTRLLLSSGFVPNQDMFSLTNGPAL